MEKPDIFLCDDDLDFTKELAASLCERGYAAHSLAAVTELPSLERASVLLLDLCMPKQDGIEALSFLRDHPQRELLWVMFVSGWDEAMVGRAVKLAELRGLQVLPPCPKPLALDRLCAILAAVK